MAESKFNFKEKILKLLENQHFMHFVGMKITEIAEGKVSGELTLKQHHQQQTGLVHGGVILSLADLVAGFAAYTVVAENEHVVTVELKNSFLYPGLGQKLIAKAHVLKKGSSLIFCESEIWDIRKGEEVLIAKATTTMAIIKK